MTAAQHGGTTTTFPAHGVDVEARPQSPPSPGGSSSENHDDEWPSRDGSRHVRCRSEARVVIARTHGGRGENIPGRRRVPRVPSQACAPAVVGGVRLEASSPRHPACGDPRRDDPRPGDPRRGDPARGDGAPRAFVALCALEIISDDVVRCASRSGRRPGDRRRDPARLGPPGPVGPHPPGERGSVASGPARASMSSPDATFDLPTTTLTGEPARPTD